ncbi:MAG: cold shock domain-containing protein [Deltaproteobacteria bacterium]|nr:MAG: cold shock domain-containing protein [Deltaproteobacteria bacterium]
MAATVEIHWYKLDKLDEAERHAAEERLEGLAANHTDLIDVSIAARPTRHHRHGAQEVRISADVRGVGIVAVRTRDEVGQALNETLDAFERELRRLRQRRRDTRVLRLPEPPYLGIVDRVFREDGYGFILTDGGEQVYFHRNALKHGLAFEELHEGQRVALNLEPGDEGPQANAVYPPPPDAPVP